MNFDYSDDQKFLKTEARRFLEANCQTSRVRAVLDDPAAAHDAGLWTAVAAQGWLGAAIPEAFCGLGLGHVELCALAEELGRALAPIPFASTAYILAEAVMLAGDGRQKAELLPRIAAGDLIGALATSEGPGVLSPADMQATVVGGRLSGVKLPVTDGGVADLALVLARENGRPGLYLVELEVEGVAREPLSTLDPTRGAAKLTFDGAPARRLGGAGEGFELLEQVLDRAAVLLAFEQCGGADRCLEMARAYALERYAFGRVIGGYQAIKHKLADMYVKNELARSNAYYGAWALNTAAPELPLAASAARIAASEAFWFASKENIQTHGGIGFTWDNDTHLWFKRAKSSEVLLGDAHHHREKMMQNWAA